MTTFKNEIPVKEDVRRVLGDMFISSEDKRKMLESNILLLQHEIRCAEKASIRGGDFLQKVFVGKKHLNGEECLQVFNTYAIHPREVYLMAFSHGCSIDSEDFIRLIVEQDERMRNSKLCNTDIRREE